MKAKIENNKLVIIPESAGEKLALEIWRLGEASIILEAYNAQQSVQSDGDYCTCKPYPVEVIRDGVWLCSYCYRPRR